MPYNNNNRKDSDQRHPQPATVAFCKKHSYSSIRHKCQQQATSMLTAGSCVLICLSVILSILPPLSPLSVFLFSSPSSLSSSLSFSLNLSHTHLSLCPLSHSVTISPPFSVATPPLSLSSLPLFSLFRWGYDLAKYNFRIPSSLSPSPPYKMGTEAER